MARADRNIIQAEKHFAQSAANQVPDLINHDEDLKYAARLKGLIDVGTYNASNADLTAAYNLKKSAYESLLKGGTFGVGTLPIPGAGIVGGGTNLIGSAIEHDIVGPAPTTTSIPDMPHTTPPRWCSTDFWRPANRCLDWNRSYIAQSIRSILTARCELPPMPR